MAIQKHPVHGDLDPKTGRISCPRCRKFRGRIDSKEVQHYCPDCDVEIITPQPTPAMLIQQTLTLYQDAMAKAAELMPLIQQLQA